MFLAEVAAVVPAVYKSLAADNAWSLIAPEILLTLLACATLAQAMLRKGRAAGFTSISVKLFLLILTAASVVSFVRGDAHAGVAFGGLLIQRGAYTDLVRIFFLLAAFGATHLAGVWLRAGKLPRTEFHFLVLAATAALMLVTQANHFVLFFVALEAAAICLYALVGYNRNSPASSEAGVKYLVCGALSSALLLAGIVLLYGAGGNTGLNPAAATQDMLRFDHLRDFIAAKGDLPVVKTGVVLVLAGVAFKIGAFLATASKGAGVFMLTQLCAFDESPFAGIGGTVTHILVPAAAITLIFGNIGALGQHNVKRLLALSGISHAGFLLLGVIAFLQTGENDALFAVIAYLFAYLAATVVTFGVVGLTNGEDDSGASVQRYSGLNRRSPFLPLVLTSGVGSLAGVPPSIGFIAKLLVLVAAFKAQLWALLLLALVCVAMGIYYYFGWLREVFNRPGEDEPAVTPLAVPLRSRLILGALALILVFGFFATPLLA